VIIFFICITIGVILGFLIGLDEDGFIVGIFFAVAGALWGAVVGFVVAFIVGCAVYGGTHYEEISRTPLVNIADGSETHGSGAVFFIGTGYIDESPSYTWYEQTGENDYVRRDVEASIATIHYIAENESPYYTIREEKKNHPFWNKWGWDMTEPWDSQYDFYVPKGTITREYTLDNK
jgi:hypothetical protein